MINKNGFIIFLAILNSVSCKTQNKQNDSEQPNIIIIYTDDMGIGDLSCYNSGWVKTPNIDKLAAGVLDSIIIIQLHQFVPLHVQP